jgi:hypothetical protein
MQIFVSFILLGAGYFGITINILELASLIQLCYTGLIFKLCYIRAVILLAES